MAHQIPMLSDDDCKSIISILCKRLCVRPRLVVERLLSDEDKDDMRNGDLTIDELEAHIKVWVANGMPDYVHAKTIALRYEQENSPVS